MIGDRAKWKTPDGKSVTAVCYAERASLPVYSVEIVDGAGEVVDCFDVSGWFALSMIAVRRRWSER